MAHKLCAQLVGGDEAVVFHNNFKLHRKRIKTRLVSQLCTANDGAPAAQRGGGLAGAGGDERDVGGDRPGECPTCPRED